MSNAAAGKLAEEPISAAVRRPQPWQTEALTRARRLKPSTIVAEAAVA